MSSRLKLAVIGVLALFATSCGGDDPLIQAMADDMAAQADGLSTDPAETLCISQASYDALGADRLAELGITVENPNLLTAVVDEREAEKLVDGLYSCVDVNEMIVSQVTSTGLPPAAADCIIETLGEDGVRQFILDQFQGEELSLTTDVRTAMLSCLGAGG